ncbi:MAG: heme ABC transporter permease [Litorivicinaceae bacterium]
MAWQWFHQWGSPRWFYERAERWQFWAGWIALVLLVLGTVWGLAIAPVDYQQGHSYRIIYLHVPVAFLAQALYLGMAVAAVVLLVWRMKLADIAIQALAVVGCAFCVLALVSGAIWGKPTWGTYWVWDARLTSMLILAFLYMGIIGLRSAFIDPELAGKACAILALVGAINLPIIKYSVEWWNTLHQPASLKLTERPAMPASMWVPLLINICAYYAAAAYLLFASMRTLVLRRERRAQWVQALVRAHD